VPRIAAARKAPPAEVQAVIAANTEGSTLGLLGEPRVNVLAVNLALDARWPRAQR
jgi:potassium-transporting ATPase KdpC subunit